MHQTGSDTEKKTADGASEATRSELSTDIVSPSNHQVVGTAVTTKSVVDTEMQSDRTIGTPTIGSAVENNTARADTQEVGGGVAVEDKHDKEDDDDDEEAEFQDIPTEQKANENDTTTNGESEKAEKGPKNSLWKAMLKRDAERAKRLKKRKGGGLVEAEADEEEEDDAITGLEDFGFAVSKKKGDDDDDDDDDDGGLDLDEEDLKHVVDDLSDNEGDEEAGEEARKAMESKLEKERHKEIIRRMREGYDGRRGGIAGGGVGARGMHRFDQLVAADNREDAKRLGLLNDDEIDSDDEGKDGDDDGKGADGEIEDETALLDKMLKDRFLQRSSVELEENFSEDEEDDDDAEGKGDRTAEDEEDRKQELLAKRFAKRARMQRLIETHGDEEEFTQARLIDEDRTIKQDLLEIRVSLKKKKTTMVMWMWMESNDVGQLSNANLIIVLYQPRLLDPVRRLLSLTLSSDRLMTRTLSQEVAACLGPFHVDHRLERQPQIPWRQQRQQQHISQCHRPRRRPVDSFRDPVVQCCRWLSVPTESPKRVFWEERPPTRTRHGHNREASPLIMCSSSPRVAAMQPIADQPRQGPTRGCRHGDRQCHKPNARQFRRPAFGRLWQRTVSTRNTRNARYR